MCCTAPLKNIANPSMLSLKRFLINEDYLEQAVLTWLVTVFHYAIAMCLNRPDYKTQEQNEQNWPNDSQQLVERSFSSKLERELLKFSNQQLMLLSYNFPYWWIFVTTCTCLRVCLDEISFVGIACSCVIFLYWSWSEVLPYYNFWQIFLNLDFQWINSNSPTFVIDCAQNFELTMPIM